MARIAGIDIPRNKRGAISLTYIYGVGRSRAIKVLEEAGVDSNKKVQDWNDDEIGKIRSIIGSSFKVEGELRSEFNLILSVLWISVVNAVFVTVMVFPLRGQELRTILELVRVRERPLRTRRSNKN